MMDYNRDSINFNLNNYPFILNKNSKEYKDYQIGMDLWWSKAKYGKNEASNYRDKKLKEFIKTELQND
jgi:hypothetical protein